MFYCEFCKIFKNNFLKNTFVNVSFWREYRYNNTKMLQVNIHIIISYPISSSLASKCCTNCCWRRYSEATVHWCSSKRVLLNFTIFTGKHLCCNNFIKTWFQHRCLPMNIAKFCKQIFYRSLPVAVSRHLHYFFNIALINFF